MEPNKIFTFSIALCLIFIGFIIINETKNLTDVQAQNTVGNTLYVGGSGPGNYTYIQDAIDDANDGDTVFIYTGTYHERITINQTITLRGEERNNTTINGTFGGTYGIVVKIYANGVYMENLTVMESGGDMENPQVGIKIYGSFTSICNCTITHNWDGICLCSGSQNNLIFNCSVTYCALFAIDMGCSNTIISQCNFSWHYYGIQSGGQNNIIEKCIFTKTSCCISADGQNNTIRHCDLIGGSGMNYFALAVQYGQVYNCTIDGHPYGIWPGPQTTVEKCRIINNHYGIDTDWHTNDSIILDCMISSNTIGINAESTGNLTIYNCTLTDNINNGINLDGCHQIDILHCHILQNNWGINITRGTGNNSIKYCDIFNNENGIHMSKTNNNLIGKCNMYDNNITGIRLFHSLNNTISSNTVTNNTRYGIQLYHSHNNTLINNTAINNTVGIYLCSSSTNTLTHNTFVNDGLFVYRPYNNQVQNNTVNGKPLIYLEDAKNYSITNAGQVILVNCTNITVDNLNLSRTTVGIELWETSNNTIKHNTVSFNLYGIYLESSHTNVLTGNTANNNTYGISLESSRANALTGNTANNNNYSISMSYSHTNTITGNTINNNTYGISLSSSSTNNTFTANTITNNFHGIYLYFSSTNNTFTANTITNNFHGIYLVFTCSKNTFTTNTLTNNEFGISLYASSTNSIYHNNFDNINNAYDDGTNTWDNGYPSGGNYWSNYTGDDTNNDGIGEKPYNITGGGNKDRYPFVDPLGSMELMNGWNLITVPFDSNWTAETLGQNIRACTVVCRFNGDTQSYTTHVVGIPYNDFPIRNGVGYFVYVTRASILLVRDLPINSINVSIYKEWNMIGWYHNSSTTAGSLGQNISNATVVCKFNVETQTYTTHVVGIPYNNFPITKGMGLFIYTDKESYWHGEA